MIYKFLILVLTLLSFNNIVFSAKEISLTQEEKKVLYYLNYARTKPKKFAKFIKSRLNRYQGNIYYDGYIRIMTREGINGARKAIQFLNNVRPSGKLTISKGLCYSALDHTKDQSRSGYVGHTGKDGSNPFERMKRYGSFLNIASENIDYGHNEALDIVIALIIDDGVHPRSHRDNIFNPKFKVAGISIAKHPQYRYMCCITLAGGFIASSKFDKVR